MILGELLPDHHKIPFDVVNKLMTKKEISNMIDTVYRNCGQKETVIFCDRIMALGFREAFKAGISFGKDDMVVPETKERIVGETRALVKEYEQQYNDGLITQGEKYNKVVDAWAKCTDKLAEEMMVRISTVRKDDKGRDLPINSIYMMSHSGARGSPAQMKQLAAMRGLMAKPSGEIIESPIISNFKEGLTVLEYFNSTHGARKGLADTALKTANSGYLTRRLVDVAQDSIITEMDCGSTGGIRMRAIIDAGQVVASLATRILGRTTAEDLKELDGTMIVAAGEMIQEWHIDRINAAGIQEVKIRSVLTCEAANGVCGKCYGRDLARGTPVNMGEAVGVIAAQSIGEPGTQLTMRTFHIGGAAQIADQSFIESNFEGTVRIRNRNVARNSEGDLMVMARNVAVVIVGPDGSIARCTVSNMARGSRSTMATRSSAASGSPNGIPIRVRSSPKSTARSASRIWSKASRCRKSIDESTGIAKRMVIDWRLNQRSSSLKPSIVIKGKDGKIAKLASAAATPAIRCRSNRSSPFDPGATVQAGDMIARISMDFAKTRDITGGLPRVAELFEARRPKDHAIIAEISGTVQFGRDYKNKQRLSIIPHEEGGESVEYLIPKGKHIHLQDGDVVEKGDYIVDGNPAPHDILAIKGVEELAAYLVNEIQEVYRLQGVNINDKHIEVIVRQMLQKVDIADPGDTDFLAGEQVDQTELEEANRKRDRRWRQAGNRHAGAARHHQGEPADAVVHLGGLVPGDDPRPHRSRRQRQGRYARGPEGERHRRPADSGRDRRGHVETAPDRRHARRTHPGAEGAGLGSACAAIAAGGGIAPPPARLSALCERGRSQRPLLLVRAAGKCPALSPLQPSAETLFRRTGRSCELRTRLRRCLWKPLLCRCAHTPAAECLYLTQMEPAASGPANRRGVPCPPQWRIAKK